MCKHTRIHEKRRNESEQNKNKSLQMIGRWTQNTEHSTSWSLPVNVYMSAVTFHFDSISFCYFLFHFVGVDRFWKWKSFFSFFNRIKLSAIKRDVKRCQQLPWCPYVYVARADRWQIAFHLVIFIVNSKSQSKTLMILLIVFIRMDCTQCVCFRDNIECLLYA